MHPVYNEIKEELKTLAFTIKSLKNKIKNDSKKKQINYLDCRSLDKARHMFRHRHIARCLLKGRTYDQIECPFCRNNPNWELIDLFKKEYLKRIQDYEQNKQNKPNNENNLYLLISNKLSKSQKTVQSVHATAELILHEKDLKGWKNGHVVCLKVKDSNELEKYHDSLKNNFILKGFFDKDISQGMTALAIIAPKNIFSELDLL